MSKTDKLKEIMDSLKEVNFQPKMYVVKLTLQKELVAIPPSVPGIPNMKRLAVYSNCFSKIIENFRIYGPLLSEIKSEYDAVISNFHSDQHELEFLRMKVQKLLSQNENRLLLKYERSKGQELENIVEKLK
ncbi:hypothetical protein HK096_001503, partial [Nowakowskiella sp. JEL0078]